MVRSEEINKWIGLFVRVHAMQHCPGQQTTPPSPYSPTHLLPLPPSTHTQSYNTYIQAHGTLA